MRNRDADCGRLGDVDVGAHGRSLQFCNMLVRKSFWFLSFFELVFGSPEEPRFLEFVSACVKYCPARILFLLDRRCV